MLKGLQPLFDEIIDDTKIIYNSMRGFMILFVLERNTSKRGFFHQPKEIKKSHSGSATIDNIH